VRIRITAWNSTQGNLKELHEGGLTLGTTPPLLIIRGDEVSRAEQYKYRGVTISAALD